MTPTHARSGACHIHPSLQNADYTQHWHHPTSTHIDRGSYRTPFPPAPTGFAQGVICMHNFHPTNPPHPPIIYTPTSLSCLPVNYPSVGLPQPTTYHHRILHTNKQHSTNPSPSHQKYTTRTTRPSSPLPADHRHPIHLAQGVFCKERKKESRPNWPA